MPPDNSHSRSADANEPHRHSTHWDDLIASLDSATILVVISSWMGELLAQECSAEDIWQETLAMAWRDRESHTWRDLGTFRGWLLGIAKNRIHDAWDHMSAQKRGGGRRPQLFSVLTGSAGGSVSGYLPGRSTTPSRVAGARERAVLMREVLAEMPEDLRIVLRLRLFEEQPMRDVALAAGIAVPTAYQRFMKGVELYQTRLEKRLRGSSFRGPPRDRDDTGDAT